jgi:hypothetical protein
MECVMERSTRSNGSADIVETIEEEIGSNIHELTRKREAFGQLENDDGEMSATDLGVLLRGVSEGSTRGIDNLIAELQGLRKKLANDRDRIQSDVVRYAEMSRGVMQLTTIISDSVKKIPCAPSITP